MYVKERLKGAGHGILNESLNVKSTLNSGKYLRNSQQPRPRYGELRAKGYSKPKEDV